MDTRDYAGKYFLKLDDVAEGPIQQTIADVTPGNYGKPELTFESGAKLSLKRTNTRSLIKAFGNNSDQWIGRRIELSEGEAEFKGERQPLILVQAASASKASPTDNAELF
jgi:hypothetical protein